MERMNIQMDINIQIKRIANYMNINSYDFESIQSMFLSKGSNSEKWYTISKEFQKMLQILR